MVDHQFDHTGAKRENLGAYFSETFLQNVEKIFDNVRRGS
jgi:hypothetical protein